MNKLFLSIAAAIGMTACVPADGPTAFGVTQDARENNIPILRLTPDVLTTLGTPSSSFDLSSLNTSQYTPGTIQPGDVIAVRIFDGGEDGMFSVENSSSLDLGEYTVSPSGTVSLPFVGAIRVAGSSVTSAQRVIESRLREMAIEPFATVNITLNATDNVTVQGAVHNSGPVSLTPRGERLLDAIAGAGGATGDPSETIVTLTRGTHSHSQLLSEVFNNPSQNVALRPGDVVIVGGGAAQFIADGAVNLTGEFDFVEGEMSLAQAIARAGGMLDSRANPRATYVFRRQPAGQSFMMRENSGSPREVFGDVIFQVDYTNPRERLNAAEFQMRSGDILYVGNAPLANFAKFFQIFTRPPEVPAPPGL